MDKLPLPLVSRSFRTPKGCYVRWIRLEDDGALVGYDCGTYGRGDFPSPGGGTSNYPHALVKGARSVHVPGATVSGKGARVDFELIPRMVTCRKLERDDELACSLHDRSGAVISGRRSQPARRKRG